MFLSFGLLKERNGPQSCEKYNRCTIKIIVVYMIFWTVAYTSVSFYEVPEWHGYVYLVGLYKKNEKIKKKKNIVCLWYLFNLCVGQFILCPVSFLPFYIVHTPITYGYFTAAVLRNCTFRGFHWPVTSRLNGWFAGKMGRENPK